MSEILVVDDDSYIRRLVSTILNDAGFDAYEAADGRDVLFVYTTRWVMLIDFLIGARK